VVADVTDQVRAEEAVRQSEARFRALVEKSQDGVCLVQADGRLAYVSPSVARILGYAPEEVAALGAADLIHPDDLATLRAYLGVGAAGPGGTQTLRCRVRHKKGHYRYLEAVATNSLHDPAIAAYVINYRDITERVRAEEALRAGEERYRALVENAPIAIWEEDLTGVAGWFKELRAAGVTDLAAHLAADPVALDYALGLVRVRDVNRAALTQNRANSKHDLITGLPRLFTPEARAAFAGELAAFWEGRTSLEYEVRAKRLDGQPMDLLVHIHVVRQDGRPDFSRVIVAGTDVTDRRRAERELAEQHALLRAVLDAIPDLIARKDAAGR
jgi:PAS domain S-box-containing protein